MEVREVTIYTAIPHLSPIGLSVIHQADEKHVDVTFQRGASESRASIETGMRVDRLSASAFYEAKLCTFCTGRDSLGIGA